jgi:formate-dependent nitrite reductase membrane component NrfD
MKTLLKTLSLLAGTLVYVCTGFAALVYLFGVVIWMHAPVVPALLLTSAMSAPLLFLGWLLLRLGRSAEAGAKPQPWYPPRDGE